MRNMVSLRSRHEIHCFNSSTEWKYWAKCLSSSPTSCVSFTVSRKIKAVFVKFWQSVIMMCRCFHLTVWSAKAVIQIKCRPEIWSELGLLWFVYVCLLSTTIIFSSLMTRQNVLSTPSSNKKAPFSGELVMWPPLSCLLTGLCTVRVTGPS